MTIRKVRIQYDDTNWHARVTDSETGEQVGRVRAVSFSQCAGELPIARLEVIPDDVLLECEAEIVPATIADDERAVAWVLTAPRGFHYTDEGIRKVEKALEGTGLPVVCLDNGANLELVRLPKETA